MTNRTPTVLRILARTAVVPTCGLSSSAAAKSSGEGSSTSASTSRSSATRTTHPRKSSGGWKNLDVAPLHAFPSSRVGLTCATGQHNSPCESPRVQWRLGSLSPTVSFAACSSQERPSNSASGMSPIGSSSRRLLNQSTHSSVANSTSSMFLQGPRLRITSVL